MSYSNAIAARFAALPGAVRAGFWIACTGTTFTGMMVIARTLSPDLPIFVIVFFRSVFGLLFLMPTTARRGMAGLRTTNRTLYIIRGGTAFTSIAGFFYAATFMPLAEIAAIGFTRPALACVAAILILGEIAHARRWAAIAIGFVGALIVVRPGFAEINPGILFVFVAVAAQVANTIIIKYLTRTDHPDTIAVYQGMCMAPIALALALFVWVTPNLEQFGWLLLMGAFGAVTQRTIGRSYAAADATV
ncbi:MAG: DMT family transporter, partial [Alphaproteobacteria bacterium]